MTARLTRRGHIAANVAAWVGCAVALALYVGAGDVIVGWVR